MIMQPVVEPASEADNGYTNPPQAMTGTLDGPTGSESILESGKLSGQAHDPAEPQGDRLSSRQTDSSRGVYPTLDTGSKKNKKLLHYDSR